MSEAIDSQRMGAARRLAKLMRDPEFRESIAALPTGEKHFIVASPDDPMSYVIGQIEEVGLPVSLVVYQGSSTLVFLTIDHSTETDEEECGDSYPITPDTHVGMLVACLWEKKCVRIDISIDGAKPAHLEFAFA